MLAVRFDAIPSKLRSIPQWVVWRLEQRKGKATKVPYDAKSGRMAKSNDPATWASFEAARDACRDGLYSGVGFVFRDGDGLTGIDLDHVIDPDTGEINHSALPILEAFRGSYTELSPSGTGLRIFCKGKPGRCGKNSGKYKWLEVYDHTSPRYLTVTGHLFGDAEPSITEQQAALDWLHEIHFAPPAPVAPPTPSRVSPQQNADSLPLDDRALVDKASRAKNGGEFMALFGGNLDGHGGDHSSADLAFCSLLAWWTNRDAGQMDRIFRTSGLMRPKWDKVHRPADQSTYGQMTIERAISTCVDGYSQQSSTVPSPVSPAAKTMAGGAGEDANGGAAGGDGRPEIRIGGGKLVTAMQEAERVLFDGREPPYFQRGGILTWINRTDMVRDRRGERIVEHGVLQLAPVSTGWLRQRMMKVCRFVSWSKSESDWIDANLPKDYAETYLDGGDWWAPVLRAVVEAPVMRMDGSLMVKKGYDPHLGVYLDSNEKWLALPKRATGEVIDPATDKPIQWAKALFKDLWEPFGPETDGDLAVLVSAVLTGLMKTQIGSAPGVVLTSPVFGSGKGMVADIISIIVTGKATPMMTMPEDGRGRPDDQAFDKKLFATLLAGQRVIAVDEIRGVLGSKTLRSALTADEVTDRILSVSKMATVRPADSLFLALGNNIRPAEDDTRRWLRGYLRPRNPDGSFCEKPHLRSFDRDAREHAKKNRVNLVCAAYVILHAYLHAGMPDMGARLGSFERWAALVASALVWSGYADPVKTLDAWTAMDTGRCVLGAMLEAWFERFRFDSVVSEKGITAGALIRLVEEAPNDPGNADLRAALGEVCGEKNGFNVRRLGNFLSREAKRVIDGMRFEAAGEHKRAVLWRVVKG